MTRREFRKNVSDSEIEIHMRPHVARLMSLTKSASASSDANSHGQPRDREDEKAPEAERADGSEGLPIQEREFLESILEEPNLSITKRRDRLGLSTYMNDRIKKSLLSGGLIEELSLHLGNGTRGATKFLELTEKGYRALDRRYRKSNRENGSPEHRWWQRNIAAQYRKEGYKTEVEMCLDNKRADVGVVISSKHLAIEIGLTPKNEAANVRADLDAGFHKVLVACRNTKVREAVRARLEGVLAEHEQDRVKVILLSEFSFVKEILGKPVSCTTKPKNRNVGLMVMEEAT